MSPATLPVARAVMARRILILDTPQGHLEELAAAFQAARREQCDVERVFAADHLLERLRNGLPWDLVIVDCDLGDGGQSGLALLPGIREAAGELAIIAVGNDMHGIEFVKTFERFVDLFDTVAVGIQYHDSKILAPSGEIKNSMNFVANGLPLPRCVRAMLHWR